RDAVFWLEQGHERPRMALGRVFRPKSALLLLDSFAVEIAPNADTALVLLVCAILDEDYKRTRGLETYLFAPGSSRKRSGTAK
ncbi:Tubby c-terminal-like domain, partial [Globisporangium polare]